MEYGNSKRIFKKGGFDFLIYKFYFSRSKKKKRVL